MWISVFVSKVVLNLEGFVFAKKMKTSSFADLSAGFWLNLYSKEVPPVYRKVLVVFRLPFLLLVFDLPPLG